MNESGNFSWLSNFSHLYVERAAFDYSFAQSIINRFPRARIVAIDDYKSIFARPRQHFQIQKRSMKLILAVKKDRFLYPGSGHSQHFNLDNFYYNTLMFNCVYNCDYCYLQGMYPSANVVAFVNTPDYFEATRQAIAERSNIHQPLYVCISYDTDLLAFESITPYCRAWIEFAQEQPDLLIEIRTKSTAYRAIRDLKATDRVILAWTLSPQAVIDRYEKGTPPLRQRLQAVQTAIDDGWAVRLCFDPVLAVKGWQAAYGHLIEETFGYIDPAAVRDVTVGVFRMTKSYFDRIKGQRQDTDVIYNDYELEDKTITYPAAQRQEITDFMGGRLRSCLPEERIAVWT